MSSNTSCRLLNIERLYDKILASEYQLTVEIHEKEDEEEEEFNGDV